MAALIEFVCRAHPQRHSLGPLITRVDGLWAYCEGNGDGDHEWMRIEPTARDHVGDSEQVEARRAS